MTNLNIPQTIEEGEVQDLAPVECQVIKVETDSLNLANNWEDLVSLWMRSKEVDNINQFFKGDIADKVGCKYGDSGLTKFSNETKESYQTVVAYRRVARAFKSDCRALDLCWTHYLLASQTDEYNKSTGNFNSNNREKWLEKAHDNNWTVNQLAVEIKKEKALVKDSIFDYYSNYFDKIENILLHLDKSQLNKQQQKELTKRLYEIADNFDNYFDKFDDSKLIEKPIETISMTKKYDTLAEAQEALVRRKQKKGSIMVRHMDNGKYDLVTEEILSKEFIKHET